MRFAITGTDRYIGVFNGFQALWCDTVPQSEGNYWQYWSDAGRTLDFSQPVAHLLRQMRTFGPYEVLAHVKGSRFMCGVPMAGKKPTAGHPASFFMSPGTPCS
jgi:hypothetical protein